MPVNKHRTNKASYGSHRGRYSSYKARAVGRSYPQRGESTRYDSRTASPLGSSVQPPAYPLVPQSSRVRKRIGVLLAILIMLVGAGFIAYPFASNALRQAQQGKVISMEEEAVEATSEDDLDAERQKAIAYNEQLLNGRSVITDPFDPDAERPTDEDYESVMNLAGDGVMGSISIPAIHVELPVYHGTDDEVLQQGVGHLEGTSVPIGGDSTHCVLSGHTGLPSMKIFDNLEQLKEGDYFILSVLGEDHAYEVTSIEVVLPNETDSLVIQPGKDLCTLVTCTPYGLNTHRLLVHAERCEIPDEWLNKGDASFPSGYGEPFDRTLLPSVLLGLALSALVIGGYVVVRRVRKRRASAAAAEVALSRTGKRITPTSGSTPFADPLPGNPYGRHVGPDEDLAASAAKAGAPVIPTGRDRRGSADGAAAGAADQKFGPRKGDGSSRHAAKHLAGGVSADEVGARGERSASERSRPRVAEDRVSTSSKPNGGRHFRR